MERKALIIGIPGIKGKSTIYNAVNHDVDYVKEFLMSDSGGKWNESEINTIINPGNFLVISSIAQMNSDYSFVYFSGHGGEYRSRNQIIELRDDDNFSITNLKTKSLKQLIIIDSCRIIIEEKKEGIIKKAIFEEFLPIINSREIFDEELEKCENGIILLNAASFTEEAGCNLTESYFTSSLIEAGYEWSKSTGGEGENQILNIWEATQNAQEIMENNFVTDQHAYCNIGRRRRPYPFAVRNCIL